MMEIVHFHRRPFPGQHSIEGLFAIIRSAMCDVGTQVTVETLPYLSKGLRPRYENARWAAQRQGDVNHITGDVHYVALALDPKRTVLTVHDCHNLERVRGIKRWLLKRYWFDLPVRHVAAITVISEATRQELVRHSPEAGRKTVVIPNAVSQAFVPSPREFNAERPRVLHIGTKPNKNLTRLIAALDGLSCELRILGQLSVGQRADLEARRISYSAAENLSEAEMVKEYNGADVVAFASTYEGFGMPIVEAQWVERPLVTSNRSSMPEVAGRGACLVDPLDVAEIRRGIARIVSDANYRADLVAEGRLNRDRFSPGRVARQYLELYADIQKSCTPVAWRRYPTIPAPGMST
jgi:glycosyltransferase involved in cell wall biosynthesis